MNLPRHDHWINGRATPPHVGDYLPTHDPMTTRPWAQIAQPPGRGAVAAG